MAASPEASAAALSALISGMAPAVPPVATLASQLRRLAGPHPQDTLLVGAHTRSGLIDLI
jgi:hypothetical protein